jgi:CubicO group peptidase (beta-lactamase class C family)
MREEITERAGRAIGEKVFPGCVVGVSQNGTREIFPFGGFTYESDSPRVAENSVYDVASITKSIPTASLAAVFIEEGKIALNDLVKKFVPELQNDFGATIEDLLCYCVRGKRMSTLHFKTFEEIRTHILESGFDGSPGESSYTNLPAYILGIVLERVSESSIAALGNKYFFEPLEMTHTTFFPSVSDCVPTEIQSGETIQGIPHDESARIFAEARRTVGHAGLFSTAGDLLVFLEAVLNDEYPTILQNAKKGLGWTTNQEFFMGKFTSVHAFGKTGFTGTSIVADPEKKTTLVILSNRTFPTRPSDPISLTSAINTFRREIADIVFA